MRAHPVLAAPTPMPRAATSHGKQPGARPRAVNDGCRMAAAAAGTVGGLYFVVTQDLGHGPGHDEDHHAETHETHGKNDEGEADEEDQPQGKQGTGSNSREESKGVGEDEKKAAQAAGPTGGPKGQKENTGAGKPDKKKAGDASQDEPKAQESGEASPDKSDKVCRTTVNGIYPANVCRPTRAASLRAPTRRPASKKVSPTATRTTRRKSPRRTARARRARVLLKRPSSRAPSPPSGQVPRTRKSVAKPKLTRMRKAALHLHASSLNNCQPIPWRLASTFIVYSIDHHLYDCHSLPVVPRTDVVF
jgi:hypothetical protein